MGTFSYTTGNPSNLTAGSTANMNDIQGSFTDVRTYINGSLDETNVPNLTAAYTTYKRIIRGAGQIGAPAAGTYLIQVGGTSAANTVVNTSGAAANQHTIDLDPAEFNANSRTTKLNVRATAIVNTFGPGITFTVGLYPHATYGGGAASGPTLVTLGTVVSGSTVALASPGASTRTTGTSGDFTCPAAGSYTFAVVTSGTPNASSVTELIVTLSMRQV